MKPVKSHRDCASTISHKVPDYIVECKTLELNSQDSVFLFTFGLLKHDTFLSDGAKLAEVTSK